MNPVSGFNVAMVGLAAVGLTANLAGSTVVPVGLPADAYSFMRTIETLSVSGVLGLGIMGLVKGWVVPGPVYKAAMTRAATAEAKAEAAQSALIKHLSGHIDPPPSGGERQPFIQT